MNRTGRGFRGLRSHPFAWIVVGIAMLARGALAAAPINAPELVADLRVTGGGAGSAPDGRSVRYSTELDGITYFAAETAEYGNELWRSDGTQAGTVLVKDIWAGREGSDPAWLVAFAGRIYFAANDGTHGIELWESNGTMAGTHMVVDLAPGIAGNRLSEIVAAPGAIYFGASDGVRGIELWRSDGTAAGTLLLADIYPDYRDSFPGHMKVVGPLVYFSASSTFGNELWVSDGTTGGTHIVRDIAAGAASSSPADITWSNGSIYFTANDGVHGKELWVSDGTQNGTHLTRDLPEGGGYGPELLTAYADGVIYLDDDGQSGTELWHSDGTEAGTSRVRDIWPGPSSGADGSANFTALLGDRVYFSGHGGTSRPQLWVSDGTEDGTQLVFEIGSYSDRIDELIEIGGRLYFITSDGTHGVEPWVSDGTTGGTRLLADIRPGFDSSVLRPAGLPGTRNFMRNGARLLFSADNGVIGNDLWRSDGTPEGTTLVRDIEPRIGSFPRALRAGTDKAYFVADDEAAGMQVWSSTGTQSGTLRLSGLDAPDEVPLGASFMTTDIEGNLYFMSHVPLSNQLTLWRSDGTAQGTGFVATWEPALYLQQGDGERLVSIGSTVYFFGWDAEHGQEPWRSDGTAAGTFRVADINPGPADSEPFDGTGFGSVGSLLVMGAIGDYTDSEPWVSDGSEQGTYRIADLWPGPMGSDPEGYQRGASALYFDAADGSRCTIWRTDGTALGTRAMIDTSIGVSGCTEFAPLGQRIVFQGTKADSGPEPWVSNGTIAGTFLLRDMVPGIDGSRAAGFVAAAAFVYFIADDVAHGRELWRTDGTTAGTKLVRDIRPGADSSAPYGITAIGRTIVFGANDGTTGYELWMSNGSRRGTVSIADIQPGSSSALPENFTYVGSSLLFSADDATHGVELWRLPVRDTDGDQVLDRVDTCVTVSNASQLDSDDDGYGNRCDADIARPNDCVVNQSDFAVLQAALGSTPADSRWNPDADLNGDRIVSARDLAILRDALHTRPGPSGLTRACAPH